MSVKEGKTLKPVRLRDEVLIWLEQRATKNGTTLSGEIGIICRERMEQETCADRAARR
jgi:hypothetical protein